MTAVPVPDPPSAIENPQSAIRNPQSAFRVTRTGRWWLTLTGLLLAIGIGKGINLLMLLADSLLAVFLLNVLAARRQSRRVRARRHLPDLVFARAPCAVEVEVANRGGGGRAAVVVEDYGPDHALSWFVPWLRRGETRTLRGEVVLPHRGRYAWGPVRVGSGYPFGLWERRRRAGDGGEVVVLPALGWLHRGRFVQWLRGADARADEVRRKPRRHPTAQAEFHGLRPFRPGDSPRLIHWRTSARLGELMTREYEDAPGQDLIVVFDSATPVRSADCGLRSEEEPSRAQPLSEEENPQSAIRNPQFEAAVSLAATVCWEWCRRRGDRLGVVVTGTEPAVFDDFAGPDHGRRVLEALALAAPSAEADTTALFGRLAPRSLAGAAVVVIGAGPDRLSGALARFLRRPVAALDAAALADCDFYDPPR